MMTKRLEPKEYKLHIDIEVTHIVHDQVGFDVAKESQLFASWSNGDGTFTHHKIPCGDSTCSVCLTFAPSKSMKEIYESKALLPELSNHVEQYPKTLEYKVPSQKIFEAPLNVKTLTEEECEDVKGWEVRNNNYYKQSIEAMKIQDEINRPREIHTQLSARVVKKDSKSVEVNWTVNKNKMEEVSKLMREKKIKIDTSRIKPFLDSIKSTVSSTYHSSKSFEYALEKVRDLHKPMDGKIFKNFDFEKMEMLYGGMPCKDLYQERADKEGITRKEAKELMYGEIYGVHSVNGKKFEGTTTGRFKAKQEDVLGRKLGVQMFRYDDMGKRVEMLECLNVEDEKLVRRLQMMKPKEVLKHKGKEILLSSRIKTLNGKRYKEIFEHLYGIDGVNRYGWNITYYEVVENGQG